MKKIVLIFFSVVFTGVFAFLFLKNKKATNSIKKNPLVKKEKKFAVYKNKEDGISIEKSYIKKIKAQTDVFKDPCIDQFRDMLQDPLNDLKSYEDFSSCDQKNLRAKFKVKLPDFQKELPKSDQQFYIEMRLRRKILEYLTKDIPLENIDSKVILVLGMVMSEEEENELRPLLNSYSEELLLRDEYVPQGLQMKLMSIDTKRNQESDLESLDIVSERSIENNITGAYQLIGRTAYDLKSQDVLNDLIESLEAGDSKNGDLEYLSAMKLSLEGEDPAVILDSIKRASELKNDPAKMSLKVYEKTGKFYFPAEGGFGTIADE